MCRGVTKEACPPHGIWVEETGERFQEIGYEDNYTVMIMILRVAMIYVLLAVLELVWSIDELQREQL